MNTTIFNTTGLVGQPLVYPPDDNVIYIMAGTGKPEEHQFPRGLDIGEVTMGTIKQTTSGLPDSIGIVRSTDMVLTPGMHGGLKSMYSDIYFETSAGFVPTKPVDFHLPTNTQLLMEMNTYEDGVRKNQIKEEHQDSRSRHLQAYKEMLERSTHLPEDSRLEKIAEANKYLMVNDPQLYQAVMSDRNHPQHNNAEQAEIPQEQFSEQQHAVAAAGEVNERADELKQMDEELEGSVLALARMFEESAERGFMSQRDFNDLVEEKTSLQSELEELREAGLVSRTEAIALSGLLNDISDRSEDLLKGKGVFEGRVEKEEKGEEETQAMMEEKEKEIQDMMEEKEMMEKKEEKEEKESGIDMVFKQALEEESLQVPPDYQIVLERFEPSTYIKGFEKIPRENRSYFRDSVYEDIVNKDLSSLSNADKVDLLNGVVVMTPKDPSGDDFQKEAIRRMYRLQAILTTDLRGLPVDMDVINQINNKPQMLRYMESQ